MVAVTAQVLQADTVRAQAHGRSRAWHHSETLKSSSLGSVGKDVGESSYARLQGKCFASPLSVRTAFLFH